MDFNIRIKTETPQGSRLLKENAENYPDAVESILQPPTDQKTYTIDEMHHIMMDKLSKHYGVDMYQFEKDESEEIQSNIVQEGN